MNPLIAEYERLYAGHYRRLTKIRISLHPRKDRRGHEVRVTFRTMPNERGSQALVIDFFEVGRLRIAQNIGGTLSGPPALQPWSEPQFGLQGYRVSDSEQEDMFQFVCESFFPHLEAND